jgi:hypothetical protein
MNGTSDLPDTAIRAAKAHPDIQFYDYTAQPPSQWDTSAPNYNRTFSRKENNAADVQYAIDHGINVAVVFDVDKSGYRLIGGEPHGTFTELPKTYMGREVIDGTKDDLRFLDKKGEDGKGIIVGLCTKGISKADTTGFAVRPEMIDPNYKLPEISEKAKDISAKVKARWAQVKSAEQGVRLSSQQAMEQVAAKSARNAGFEARKKAGWARADAAMKAMRGK